MRDGRGIVDRRALPSRLLARAGDDVEGAAALSRDVRGGAYGPGDLAFLAARPGFALLAVEGRGFTIHGPDGRPAMLCPRDDEAAADLLWSALAGGHPGATVHVDFLSAGQDWAVRTLLDAGLALSVEGPLFTRGELGPLRPFLPSGAFL